jgi:hypothetical protein
LEADVKAESHSNGAMPGVGCRWSAVTGARVGSAVGLASAGSWTSLDRAAGDCGFEAAARLWPVAGLRVPPIRGAVPSEVGWSGSVAMGPVPSVAGVSPVLVGDVAEDVAEALRADVPGGLDGDLVGLFGARLRLLAEGLVSPVPRPGLPRVPIGMISASPTALASSCGQGTDQRRLGGPHAGRPEDSGTQRGGEVGKGLGRGERGLEPEHAPHPGGVQSATEGEEGDLLR